MQELLYIVVSAFRAFWLDPATGRYVPDVRGGEGEGGGGDDAGVDLSDLTKFPKLKEAHEKYAAKRTELKTIFDEAGPDRDLAKVTTVTGGKDAVLAAIRELNDEVTVLGKERNDQIVLVKAVKAMDNNDEAALAEMLGESGDGPLSGFKGRKEMKSFGEQLVESKAGTEFKGREMQLPDFEVKALFETGAGWAPEVLRGPRLVLSAQRPIQVSDVPPTTTTTQSAIKFMQETTFTNTAAETDEGAAYNEAALVLIEELSPVEKITVWIPITDEQLEDVPQAMGYLNNRLPFMVRQRLDGQIISGNGTSPNLRGFLNTGGIQTQAKGGDPVPDAIYKAITKTEVVGQAFADNVMLHSNDWQDVRLLRTADGIYIWGSPSDPGPNTIWGLPVVKMQVSEGTGLVGDFGNFSELAIRRGLNVKVGLHGNDFIEGKQAVRCDIRVALVVYRPAAFVQVTGI